MRETILHWLLAALLVLVTAQLVPGFEVTSFVAALAAALVLGLLNAFVWPLLVVLTLPLTVVTFGLFLLVLNAVILKLGAMVVPGVTIDGFLPAFIGALLLTILGALMRFAGFART